MSEDDAERRLNGVFEADTERAPGDDNVRRWGFDVHPRVFPIAAGLTALFIVVTLLFGDIAALVGLRGSNGDPMTATAAFGAVLSAVSGTFGWFYILAVNAFVVVVLAFALSGFGNVRLGGPTAEPEFSDFAWYSMLFSAGMGIGLMFWSVGEPITHLGTVPPFFDVQAGTAEAGRAALGTTFFHWGLHPWAIYALVGLGLAFFAYNRGLPLTFRSVFWPILGERIYDWPGDIIDVLAVVATLFGLSTSLGLGVQQINAGLTFLSGRYLPFSIPDATFVQVGIIAVITAIATLSVVAGLDGGVKRLSELNLYVMGGLLGATLLLGPTVFLLGTFVETLGFYVNVLPELAFWSESFTGTSWQNTWTVFYWGWWVSWSPFVGMFIARISRGRTVREFLLGVLVLPALFSFLWMSVFGGSALFVELNGGGGLSGAVDSNVATAMFELFAALPLTAVTSVVAVVLVTTFFVTSSDSGSLVVDHMTAGGKREVPTAQRVFWAVAEGAIAAVLLIGGGLSALRTAAITTGLPFTFVLLLTCYTLYRGLSRERETLESDRFRAHVDRLVRDDDVEVRTSNDSVVTDVRNGAGGDRTRSGEDATTSGDPTSGGGTTPATDD
ncbi:BCCT family transporter [Halomarina oriensis]|uniref:BCCT family transporter n=1 Tax=Halomarina oriensis TaxID=671145 RepID=A0A6B0GXR0_9EURY|nr:BCCT family transporter [Halomarina oriensis]